MGLRPFRKAQHPPHLAPSSSTDFKRLYGKAGAVSVTRRSPLLPRRRSNTPVVRGQRQKVVASGCRVGGSPPPAGTETVHRTPQAETSDCRVIEPSLNWLSIGETIHQGGVASADGGGTSMPLILAKPRDRLTSPCYLCGKRGSVPSSSLSLVAVGVMPDGHCLFTSTLRAAQPRAPAAMAAFGNVRTAAGVALASSASVERLARRLLLRRSLARSRNSSASRSARSLVRSVVAALDRSASGCCPRTWRWQGPVRRW